ncbi:four-carbon acid sugar kinase family protein [Paenibacillus hexagrammi]|uniref:Four-carbon acid sugar kinase family protein n=1 Tax=Paenibacillus hexagrammi TaxID=2908839 RepID=A0ABY3SP62_9BACL|nr:four-carbon acid sugar kinase family protein [Paenibacillus sp. YPD9-1]UJF35627.1 four-carbon acid sugar kinase family protein [Paenibacillus sp. YPD9-1]
MKVAVIADDFTGAGDAGVQFAKHGMHVSVLFQLTAGLDKLTGRDVLVLDTDSRSLDAKSAYIRTAMASLKAQAFGADVVLKKIDSTLRGNIGAELDALYDTIRPDFIIIAPAYPEMGRLVRQGMLYVNGIPLQDTEFARDPKTPVIEPYIPDLLRKQTKRSVEIIPSAIMEEGKGALVSFLQNGESRGVRYLVADSAEDSDLKRLVAFMVETDYTVVWAGSAGLADHLSSHLCGHFSVDLPISRPSETLVPEKIAEPILTVVGSVSSRSRCQLDILLQLPHIQGVKAESYRLLTGHPDREREIMNAVEQADLALRQNVHTVLYSSGEDEDIRIAQEVGSEYELNDQQVSDEIACALGEVVSRLIKRVRIGGIVLTGGDTARHIGNSLRIHEFRLYDEVERGIPAGLIVMDQPLPAVTKAGGFGSDHALVKALELLHRGMGMR